MIALRMPMKKYQALIACLVFSISPCYADAPPAHAVASAHPLATQAGIGILQDGGNAFDAAIAVSAALAVVEPYSSGFGGGGFWLIHRARDGKQVMLDGRETAPALAHHRMYLDEEDNVVRKASLDGPLAAGIPGMPAALVYLAQRYGRLPLSKTLAPAIRYAEQGFKVTARYHRLASYRAKTLRQFPSAAEIFLHEGKVPRAGYLLRQTARAKTAIDAIAERGRPGFYTGPVARKLMSPLSETLAPAKRYAEQRFKVTERYDQLASYRAKTVGQLPSAAGIFLHEGKVPEVGYLLRQTALAKTIGAIAEKGRAGFYTGPVARELVREVRKHGGIWSLDDLKNYRVVERQPTVTEYGGARVVSASPPSSGGIVIAQTLQMLSKFDLHEMSGIQRKHHIVEAMRRAYRDRAAFLGDPDFVDIPVARLLDEPYLDGQALTIDPSKATPSAIIGDSPALVQTGTDTTHFSVMDKEGNRVAGTLSINTPFGSGFVAGDTGVLLNNEMDDFSIKPYTPNAYGLIGNEANAIAPGKRPLSSMTPTFLETADRIGILGTPGGSRIISMVLLATLDFVDGNLPQSWVSRRRFHHQYQPDQVQFEQYGLTGYEQQALAALGHELNERSYRYGNMQAILWDKRENKVYAASDPRGEGAAEVVGQ